MKKQLTKEEKELRRDKIVVITAATLIYGTCISLSALSINALHNHYTNAKYETNAQSLINDCITEDYGLRIAATNEATDEIAEIYVSGAKLEEVVTRNDIKYCEILDEYYTANGERIAYCEATRVSSPVAHEKDGETIYVIPSGATLKNGHYYEKTTCYVIENNGEYQLPIDYTLDNVIEIIETKPYSELIEYDLAIKSGEEYVANGTCEKEEYILQKCK